MMNLPFALAAEDAINWGERASTAGTVTLMGMVTIFAVLASLWAIIEVMHFLLHKGEKKEKAASKPEAAQTSAPAGDTAVAAAIAAALAASEDDGAVVAAITAAITALRAEEGNSGEFRVVSFKRVGRTGGRRRV